MKNNRDCFIINSFCKKINNFAFSLIEISISFIVLALLAAAVLTGASMRKSAKTRSILTEVRGIETALYAYYAANGNLPQASNDDHMYFGNNCQVWKELYDNNIVLKNEIKSCDNSREEVIEAKYSNGSKDKNVFWALGYNKHLARNTLFLLSSNVGEDSSPETIEILENISHASNSKIKKTNNAAISNEMAKELDNKIDNGIFDSGRVQSFSAESRGNGNECNYNAKLDKARDVNCTVSFSLGSLLFGDTPGCLYSDLPTYGVDYDFIGDVEKPVSIGKKFSGHCKEHYRPKNSTGKVEVACVIKGTYGVWEENNPCRSDLECVHSDIIAAIKTHSTFKDLNTLSYEDDVLVGKCDNGYYTDKTSGNQDLSLTCVNNEDLQGWYYSGVSECRPMCTLSDLKSLKFKIANLTSYSLFDSTYGKWFDSNNQAISKPSLAFIDNNTTYKIHFGTFTSTPEIVKCVNGVWQQTAGVLKSMCLASPVTVSNGSVSLNGATSFTAISGKTYYLPGAYYEFTGCNSGYLKSGNIKKRCDSNGTWVYDSSGGWCPANCSSKTASNRIYIVFTNSSKDSFYDYVGGSYSVTLNHGSSTTKSFCIEFNLTNDSMGYYGNAVYSCYNGSVTLSIDSISFTHNDSYCKDESGKSWNIKRSRPGGQDCAGHTNRRNLGNYTTTNSPGGNTSCNSYKL